jgi:hypothetical protein
VNYGSPICWNLGELMLDQSAVDFYCAFRSDRTCKTRFDLAGARSLQYERGFRHFILDVSMSVFAVEICHPTSVEKKSFGRKGRFLSSWSICLARSILRTSYVGHEVERNASRIELNEESVNHFDRSSVGR